MNPRPKKPGIFHSNPVPGTEFKESPNRSAWHRVSKKNRQIAVPGTAFQKRIAKSQCLAPRFKKESPNRSAWHRVSKKNCQIAVPGTAFQKNRQIAVPGTAFMESPNR